MKENILTYEVTQQLYIVLPKGRAIGTISIDANGYGDFIKMEKIEANLLPEGNVRITYFENSPKFWLNGIWFNGDIISLKYVFTCYCDKRELFTTFQTLAVVNWEPRYGICKLSFEVEGDLVILGTMEKLLPFEKNKIYYEQECPDKNLIDYVVISRSAVLWNANYIINSINNDYNKYAKIEIPKIDSIANNYILENYINTTYSENETHYIIRYDKSEEDEFNVSFSVDLINSVDNEFISPIKESSIVDISTKKTREKAKEILANDNSDEPDYIKLGKWVKNNMKYSLSYYGEEIKVDEILTNLIGASDQYTKLYNSLLLSIGIKAININGQIIKSEYGSTERINLEPHTWTMAKINGKWKYLDVTWGLFFDKFPISHVFTNFFELTKPCKYSGKNIEPEFNGINFIEFLDEKELLRLKE
jgi:hypothetical protein